MPAMVHALALALLATLVQPQASSDEVDVGAARLAPPAGFRRVTDSMVHGSAALLPLVAGEAPRGLMAAFVEAGEGASATLVVGRIDRPLELEPAVRASAASAIAGHFRGELDLEVVVDRAVLVQGTSGPRLEARAHTRAGAEPREVRFAFVPGGAVHYVLAASVPQGRSADFEEPITRAFDSFHAPASAAPASGRGVLVRVAAFGAAGAAVVVALRLWLRRRKA